VDSGQWAVGSGQWAVTVGGQLSVVKLLSNKTEHWLLLTAYCLLLFGAF
jgi:hypothetical protein